VSPSRIHTVPDPLRLIDPEGQTQLYIDADLGATGNALAILSTGNGAVGSVALDLDDVRAIREWAQGLIAACEWEG
jgi:16S rRNA C1402 N4-methylase RsmH